MYHICTCVDWKKQLQQKQWTKGSCIFLHVSKSNITSDRSTGTLSNQSNWQTPKDILFGYFWGLNYFFRNHHRKPHIFSNQFLDGWFPRRETHHKFHVLCKPRFGKISGFQRHQFTQHWGTGMMKADRSRSCGRHFGHVWALCRSKWT